MLRSTKLFTKTIVMLSMFIIILNSFGITMAQNRLDYTDSPTFGTFYLDETDMFDSVAMTSGGSVQVSSMFSSGSSCLGYAAISPDVSLNLSASDFTRLIIEFDNSSRSDDTTLIVRAPDGSYYCDDDSGDNYHARVTIDSIVSGYYDVWVGSYSSSDYHYGILSMTGRDIRPYGLICLRNDTDITINYSYRWGSGNWQSSNVDMGRVRTHWWTYESGSRTSPTFEIRFDEDLSSRSYNREYSLQRHASAATNCDDGYEYEFQYLNSAETRIDLFNIEN